MQSLFSASCNEAKYNNNNKKMYAPLYQDLFLLQIRELKNFKCITLAELNCCHKSLKISEHKSLIGCFGAQRLQHVDGELFSADKLVNLSTFQASVAQLNRKLMDL